jgi:uncharacterized damage-inducible protein DinB
MRPIFQMFANYNGWANARLYAAAAQLPDAEYRADHGAFFNRSIIFWSATAFGCSA